METTRRKSRLRVLVFVLLALLGGSLLAFSPRPRQQETEILAERIHTLLPDVRVSTDDGLLRRDRIYVFAVRGGGPARYLARIRPASRQRVNVAFYDAARSSFGSEQTMDLDTMVSRIGSKAYGG